MTTLIATFAAWVTPLLAQRKRAFSYEFTWSLPAILALVAGVLILIRPKFLNAIVAVYLIIVGLLGLVRLSF